MTIDRWRSPHTFGDWMGACGPVVPNATDYKEEIDFIASIGLKWVRLNADFAWLNRPTFWDTWRTGLRYAKAAGLEPLVVFTGVPDGLSSPSVCGGKMPSDIGLDDYQEVTRVGFEAIYDAGVRAIETRNEWDGPGVGGIANVDIPRFVAEHRLVYELWHSIGARYNDDVLCITGGVSIAAMQQADGTRLYPDVATAKVLNCRGALAHDGYGAHPYGFTFDPWATLNADKPWNGPLACRRAGQLVQQQRPGERMWITEVGWPTDVLTERQAHDRANIDLLHFIDWQNGGLAGPIFVYEAAKDGTPGHDNSHKYGLRRADGTAKPTVQVLKSYATMPVPSGRTP